MHGLVVVDEEHDEPEPVAPVAETAAGRLDSYAPDDFKYQISAKELAA